MRYELSSRVHKVLLTKNKPKMNDTYMSTKNNDSSSSSSCHHDARYTVVMLTISRLQLIHDDA